MIILDLEWNRGYDRIPLEEILQIGAVRVESLGAPISDTFNIFIKPVLHKKFDRGARSLPELEASRQSDIEFPIALKEFVRWCGDETDFALWGGDDWLALAQNCAYWRQPVPKMGRLYDLQASFSHLLGTNQQIALWRAAEYCRIPDTFTYHNALNDAVYTALVGGILAKEALACRPPEALDDKLLRFHPFDFPPQPRRKVGPHPSLQKALNDPLGRTPACPLCGRHICVTAWSYASPGQYFAAFRCPGHGRFLCRLTLEQAPDGRWQGRLAVPPITSPLLREYRRALQGSTFTCKAHRRHRKRRRPAE